MVMSWPLPRHVKSRLMRSTPRKGDTINRSRRRDPSLFAKEIISGLLREIKLALPEYSVSSKHSSSTVARKHSYYSGLVDTKTFRARSR